MFEAVRDALGDKVEICFDIHTRLDPADAIQFCSQVEQYRPFFIEDPIRSEGPNSFRHLRQQTRVPLAAGEQFASKWEFRQFIDEDLIDYARIDLCIAGGISEARKIAGWCETHYIKLATHNPGTDLIRGLPAPEPGNQQCGCHGTAAASRKVHVKRSSRTNDMGRWLPVAPNRSGFGGCL